MYSHRVNSLYLHVGFNPRAEILVVLTHYVICSVQLFLDVCYFVFAGSLSVLYSKFRPAIPCRINACLVEGYLDLFRSLGELVDKFSS